MTPTATVAATLLTVSLLLPGNPVDRSALARELTAVLRQSPNDYEALHSVTFETSKKLDRWSETRELLIAALEQTRQDKDTETLRVKVREACAMLTFEPLMESPMPDEFPPTTPLGEVIVKSYPKYRLARVKTRGQQNAAFFALFAHIQQNDISMTAPVEMTYPSDEDLEHAPTMAFLYGPDAPEDTKAAAGVDVLEIDPITVVSSGHRGWQTPERVEQAKQRLLLWLKEQRPDLQVVGPLRLLGYNSPSIGPDRRYFEVQLEVTPVATQDAGRTASF